MTMDDITATDEPTVALNAPQAQGIVLTATYVLCVNGDRHEIGTAQATTPEGQGCTPSQMVSDLFNAPVLQPTALAQAVTDLLDEAGVSCG